MLKKDKCHRSSCQVRRIKFPTTDMTKYISDQVRALRRSNQETLCVLGSVHGGFGAIGNASGAFFYHVESFLWFFINISKIMALATKK